MNAPLVEEILLRDLILECLAGAENGHLLGGNLDDFLGVLGIASLAGRSFPNLEGSEAHQLDLLSLCQRTLDSADKGVDRMSRHFLAHIRRLGKLIDEVGLGHS
jgi:hypothetical protein